VGCAVAPFFLFSSLFSLVYAVDLEGAEEGYAEGYRDGSPGWTGRAPGFGGSGGEGFFAVVGGVVEGARGVWYSSGGGGGRGGEARYSGGEAEEALGMLRRRHAGGR